MANTVIPGDHLMVKKRAFGKISRGDIIVFRYPSDNATSYIARVIGLPGETIEMRKRSVFINNRELDEQRVIVNSDDLFDRDTLEEISTEGNGAYRVFYIDKEHNRLGIPLESEDYTFGSNGGFQIPDDEYFVMGDNRDNSEDSRYRGTVPRRLVFGKALMIYWSQQDRPGHEKVRWNRMFTKMK